MEVFALSKKGYDHEENEDAFLIDNNQKLFAVADGVSIPKGGKEAAKLAVNLLQKSFKGDLKEAIRITNEKVVKAREENKCGFTTLTALHVKGKKAFLCWVGDSPAFLIRNKKISLLTSFEDSYGNILLQAIGNEKINIHEKIFEIRENDMILLLTDGISSVLSQEEIFCIANEEKGLEKLCEKLIEKAEEKEKVYRDDKTVVAISF